MNGKEAHAAILDMHAELRRRIDAIDVVLRRELERPGPNASSLRDMARELALAIREHVKLEERELEPILHRVDAWGPGRVEWMHEGHVRQRRVVGELLSLTSRRRADQRALALAVCEFVDDLIAEIEDEERVTLPPLLDDGEVIVVRQHAE